MRIITTHTEAYKFEELSEDAKHNAINRRSDINVDREWWQFTCDDAEDIGLKITGFDCGRASVINGNLTLSACKVAEKIKANHGKTCNTYKLAVKLLEDAKRIQDALDQAEANASNDICDVREKSEIEMEDLETEFERALKTEYLHILGKEYEYLTSLESITPSPQIVGVPATTK
jgi:hypothetical protein